MSSNEHLGFLLALMRFQPFGATRLKKLLSYFQTPDRIFTAQIVDLCEAGIDQKLAERFCAHRQLLNPEGELALLAKHEVKAVVFDDDAYPALLKTIYDPPQVLLYRGTLPSHTRKCLAVVGTRKITPYGERAIKEIVEPVAASGVVIVSGLAFGVDACAHQAALNVGGTTIAILGSGVEADNLYPSQHRSLASQIIASGGAVITEFPIGTQPFKSNFPVRNRIIAGWSEGTLVVEAAVRSGSLITARVALEAGRNVLAIPGPFYAPFSEGPNNLIKMGATPVTRASDILQETEETITMNNVFEPASAEEATIWRLLTHEPIHTDMLVQESALTPSIVNQTLTLMEMKGAAKHIGGMHYVRS